MIKVNLLKDIMGGAYQPSPSGVAIDSGSAAPIEGAGGNADILVKVVIFVLPLVATYVMRSYMVNVRQSELSQLQKREASLEAKLESFQPGLRDIEKFQDTKKKLNAQLDVIRQLSKERLKNVKSLDALQSIIPDKAWLSSLKITGNNMMMEGYATDDIIISDFMKNLSTSIYFANVALESSEEAKFEDGSVKKFSIKCTLENF